MKELKELTPKLEKALDKMLDIFFEYKDTKKVLIRIPGKKDRIKKMEQIMKASILKRQPVALDYCLKQIPRKII